MEKFIRAVLEANLLLPAFDLARLTWGNVSAIDRERGLVVIKPSGVPYPQLTSALMVVIDLSGKVISGSARPSSDTPTHLELYRRFETIGAVVHTHSRWATSWAQACRDLPAYGTTHADAFYGAVPCTRAMTDGEISTDYELNTGRVIAETFETRQIDPAAVQGVLVAHHGPFTWGKDALTAVHNAVTLEECAMIAAQTEALNPDCKPLPQAYLDKHFLRKHGKQAYYGQG